MQDENFGDRPQKLLAAFQSLDKKGTRRVPVDLVLTLLTKFDGHQLTKEEQAEFIAEAGDRGTVLEYEPFVKNVIFGKV